ncbi:regulator of G-protein signaling 21-like [Sebastes umbrosus]|uniref:regulator of G-protein signaling 21-like n=1 Tax=Sebastes umbrosus TaxID=72105 RepID=UPI00189FF0BB|nr:regulator of G-protein signaling 21-like [Sebastes umbrosus]
MHTERYCQMIIHRGSSTMNSETSLDLQDTKTIHNKWKSRLHKIIQNPLPWRKINRKETNETSLLGESLETLLSQKCGQMAFRDFLKSEFCEENLDFWLACREFKTSDSPEELTRRAASIYEEFIGTEAPRQVNLDFYTRDIIRQSLHQPSPSCFVVAQRKIYSLMENGSFPRFIQSEQHRVLFDAASKQRGLGRHRKALKIRSTGDLMPRDSKPISLQSQLYLLHKD